MASSFSMFGKQLIMDINQKRKNDTEAYEPIENYGIIGNLHTVALVSIKGSIDFLSFPAFEAPTIFAKLLDVSRGGYFSIQPLRNNVTFKQLYLPDTNILVTRFLAEDGIGELTDFMPVTDHEDNCTIIRKITTVRGKMRYRMICNPAFDYGRSEHKIIKEENALLFLPANKDLPFRLLSDLPLDIREQSGFLEFTLEENQCAVFILEAANSTERDTASIDEFWERSYSNTTRFWQNWIEQSLYNGRWLEIVNRSALTLKLLTSCKHGSVVAAPTFGLPESVGGIRNWDYRYTWIRDAAFTMYAFLRLGFKTEAEAFLEWIQQRCLNSELQLMYAVDGHTELNEYNLDHFEGFMGSKPVRVGNDAHRQFQLDIYGPLLDTIYLYNKHGGAITYTFWNEIEKQVNFVIANWQKPDHGIWEIRSNEKEFLHSRLMCWVAIDRAIKIAKDRSFPYPILEWQNVRDEIFKDIFENFWNEEKETFVQHKGTDAVDASVLLMPLVRFISPNEERWKSTMKAVDKELRADVLVYRYRNFLENIDGLKGEEGTFTMCSFWHVECLSKAGETQKAREHFEKMLGYANHLGLFSEQLGHKGEHLGNFPQAFTHLALISAAIELNKDIHNEKTVKAPKELQR